MGPQHTESLEYNIAAFLDAAGADRVMTAVSEIAAAGTSVICTIHQPSSRIFALCTHLLLLQEGYAYDNQPTVSPLLLTLYDSGEVMYFGPVGDQFSEVLGYFSRTFHKRPGPKANAADFILMMSKVEEGSRSPAEVWRETPEAKKALGVHTMPKYFFDRCSFCACNTYSVLGLAGGEAS